MLKQNIFKYPMNSNNITIHRKLLLLFKNTLFNMKKSKYVCFKHTLCLSVVQLCFMYLNAKCFLLTKIFVTVYQTNQ